MVADSGIELTKLTIDVENSVDVELDSANMLAQGADIEDGKNLSSCTLACN